ncbi:DUF1289 domain-containing protein [Roseibium sp. SCP14]|uniref:DUF1289 domain-containing protein n=1 Tax=Roseibium sp. SCP14 TaxID=3141375 RepID=UPI0033388DED
MKSPCINICQIDQKRGLCTGCLRSLDEIAGWASFSDDERAEVLSDLDRRRENGSLEGEQ